jgi:hypothetical protein
MNLFTKSHLTDKIPTLKGNFLGLDKNQSIRNLEVGDWFCLFPENENLLVFILQDWSKIYFLNIIDDKVIGEIEYNVLTDTISIIESTNIFENKCKSEIINLKNNFS